MPCWHKVSGIFASVSVVVIFGLRRSGVDETRITLGTWSVEKLQGKTSLWGSATD